MTIVATKKLSDYLKVRTDLNDFLPAYLKTDSNLTLNENLFNRFLTKKELVEAIGIIGDIDPTDNTIKPILESTQYRQDTQLQPVVSAKIGSVNHYLTFQDFLKRAELLGIDISRFDEWGNATQFNWAPPIDFDKIVNYQDYYWNTGDQNIPPNYVVIKNMPTWAAARSIQGKKTLFSFQTNYTINTTDVLNNKIFTDGNITNDFSVNDFLVLTDEMGNYEIFRITQISYVQNTNQTSITLLKIKGRLTTSFKRFVNTKIPSRTILKTDYSFDVIGNYSALFTEGYVFSTNIIPSTEPVERTDNFGDMWTTKSSTYDPVKNITTIFVNETGVAFDTSPIPNNYINFAAFLFVLDGETSRITNYQYSRLQSEALDWYISEISTLLWRDELTVKAEKNSGITQFQSPALIDYTATFVGVKPGDYLVITTGPNVGTYLITTIYNNNIAVQSNFKFFSDYCSYKIIRKVSYHDMESSTAPVSPANKQIWIDTVNDNVKQWGALTNSWYVIINKFSSLKKTTNGREDIPLSLDSDWSNQNLWIHKDQIVDYTDKTRAQVPIIEYSPFIELSTISYAKKTWKYKSNPNNSFIFSKIEPTIFELLDIKVPETGNAFQFDSQTSIVFDQKYGNLTQDLISGYKLNFVGFDDNDGVYEVNNSEYVQLTPNERYVTRVTLKEPVISPYDVPVDAAIRPLVTSMGDKWLGPTNHWNLENIEILPSSILPEKNPMLDSYVGSYEIVSPYPYETHFGLSNQQFHLTTDSFYDAEFTFDASLHDLVLYDDYQEGDIRVFINGVRQYGNFADVKSVLNELYVGGIKFNNKLITPNDIVSVELGEYAKNDIGRRSVALPIYTKSDATSLDFNTTLLNFYNLVNYRNIEQSLAETNQYPYFRIFDIDGTAKEFSTNIFVYKEDSTRPINSILNKRIVYDSIKRDYQFTQQLSDPVTKELYCYKDLSKNDNQFQTIWKVGTNIEQYVPQPLDGSWEIPNQLYYNAHHDNYSDIKLTELFKHFRSIISEQKVEGIITSNGKNYYLDDNINYGLGGTIKEHNDGFDLLVSSLFSNNSNIISLIEFAKRQYLFQLRFVQDQYTKNIISILSDRGFNSLEDISNSVNDFLINNFQNDEKFDQWFGDSTAYNADTSKGIKNWIATLPILKIIPKTKPYLIVDSSLQLYDIVHHDGHRSSYLLSPALIESFYKLLTKTTTVIQQNVTNDTENFPSNNNGNPLRVGDFVLRTITSTKKRKLYRFNNEGIWELIDFNQLLTNSLLNIEEQLFEGIDDDSLPENFTEKFNFEEVKNDPAYDSLNQTQFAQYLDILNIKTPFSTEITFDQNNPFTWNYFYSPVPSDPTTGNTNYNTAACWEALYENVYGTPYPHLEPWKLQGYKNKPDWWDSTYLSNNPTRKWNVQMWNNISYGIVPINGFTPNGDVGTGQSYQLSTTYNYFSVNIDDNPTIDGILPDGLLPPFWNSKNSPNIKVRSLYDPNLQQFVTLPNASLDFNQNGFNEWSWKKSTDYFYDQMIVSFKIQPMRFLNQLFGNEFTIINCLQIEKDSKKVFSHKDSIFHGEYIDKNTPIFKSNGLNQWYVHYNRYLGFDGVSSEFKTLWKNWDNPLSYLFGSFIDVNSFSCENQNFEVNEKDYSINLKKTFGIENRWMDSLHAVMLSVPSRYSKFRDKGLGWTVQFTSSSPISRNIPYYIPQNYPFEMKANNATFRTFSYSVVNVGIRQPQGYQIINYNQKINLNTPTGFLNNNFTYYASVALDSTTIINLNIRGYKAQTFQSLLNEINKQLGKYAVAEIDLGNIKITSNKVGGNSAVVISDSGLFASSSTFFANILPPAISNYNFEKYFDVIGNITSTLQRLDKFTISHSTQFNGEYTVKNISFDIDSGRTRIFVDTDITITSNIIDGILEPNNAITLPDEWVTGTELFLNTNGIIPSNFDDQIPFYLLRINDREFKLTNSPASTIPIVPNSDSLGPLFVGKLRTTFKALSGENTEYVWRKHEPDKRYVCTVPQPFIISGMQEIVDFITGYDEYHSDIGFICKSPNAENNDPQTGRVNDWQYVLEQFIDWSYKLRSIHQQDELQYPISFSFDGSTIDLVNANINWQTGTKVTLGARNGATLPEPFDNPFVQFVPYYVVRNYETTSSFKLALSKLDAQKGRFVEFVPTNSTDYYIQIVPEELALPEYELNPFKNYIWIEHEQGILCDVFEGSKLDVLTNQRIYNPEGDALNKSNVLVFRNDTETRISLTTELVNKVNSGKPVKNIIGGMHIFFDGYEHILPFNHYSSGGVLIYDSFLGLRTPRFYVEFNKQDNYTLRPNVGGYILDGTDLVQNMESLTDDMRYYYDTYKSSELNETTKKIRQSLGYEGIKDYMSDLRINPKSQFVFWKGMIQNKGTNFAINAFVNQEKFNDARLDEFWAYKVAEFGDIKDRKYIELKLKTTDAIRNEMRLEFTLPEENSIDESFETVRLTDIARWWNQPDQLAAMPSQSSFYFDVDVVAYSNYVSIYDFLEVDNKWYLKLNTICDFVVISYFDQQTQKTKTLTPLIDYRMFNAKTVEIISQELLDYLTPNTFISVASIRYNYDAQNPARLIDKKSRTVLTNVPFWNPAVKQYYYNAETIIDIKAGDDPALYNNRLSGNTTTAPWTEDKLGTVWMDNRSEGYTPYYDSTIIPDINERIYRWGETAEYNEITLYEWTESRVSPEEWDAAVASDLEDINISNSEKRTGVARKVLYHNTNINNPQNLIPNWVEENDSHFEDTALFISRMNTNPFDGNVMMYINGKFDMQLDLTNYMLKDYVNPSVSIPGQKQKPNMNDTIHVIKKGVVLASDDPALKNGLYKYDTPYTVVTKFDKTTNSTYDLYYFWVSKKTNKIELPEGFMSLLEAEKQITQMPLPYMILDGLRTSDFGYGLIYGNTFDGDSYALPLRYTKLIVKNFDGMVKEDERYSLRFTRDFTLRDKMIMGKNTYHTPLYLKNKHEEWKVFRENQSQKIDVYLWNKLIEGILGYRLDVDENIDYTKPIPALNRVLYDNIYNTDTRFGFDNGQIFFDTNQGKNTLMKVLSDPSIDYGYVDINTFLQTYSFDNTPEESLTALKEIYNNFAPYNINKIFFELMKDSFTTKRENSDIFKTSWVALEVEQNVKLPINVNQKSLVVKPDGICGLDLPIEITPTPTPPKPTASEFPTPTPTTTVSNTPTPTPQPTPTLSSTPSVTPTLTMTITQTFTPTFTPTVTTSLTPTISNTPTISTTPSVTPSVTPTIPVTPSNTPTISVTPSVTLTISPTTTLTPTISSTISLTPTISNTPSTTTTITPTPTFTPTITETIPVTPSITPTISVTPSVTPTISVTPTQTSTISVTPTNTASNTVTPTNTITPTATPTLTPTNTVTTTLTPTQSTTVSLTPTLTPTPTNSSTLTPTVTATTTNTPTPTASNTIVPSPSVTPSPTLTPTSGSP